MPDNVLSFETKVDLSGLNTGFSQATNTVQTSSQRMAQAMAAASAATNQLASAQQQLGTAAASGSAAAAAVIQQYQQQVTQTQAAVNALASAQTTLAASTNTATTAQHAQVSALAATSAEVRLLEGALPIRAVENFLAKTLNLGPVMQAAFPVFGAIALGEVLFDVGKKAQSLYENFLTLKVEGEDLAKGLAKSGEEIAASWGRTLSIFHQTGMRDNPIGTLSMDATDAGIAIQGLQGKLATLQSDLSQATSTRQSGNYLGAGTTEEGNDNRILGVKQRIEQTQQQINELEAKRTDILSQQAKKEDVSTPTGPDPQIQALRDLEIGLNKAKLAMDVSAQDEADYWSSSIQLFRDGSTQYEAVLQKTIAARNRVAQEFGQSVLKEVADDQRRVDEAQKVSDALIKTYNDISKQQQEADKVQQEFNAEVAKGQEIQAQNAANLSLASISISQQSGFITKLSADHAIASIHAQEYTEKLAALKQQLDAINAENPTSQAGVNDQEKRSVSVQNQMSQVQGQQQVSKITDSAKQAQDLAQPYLTAFNDINAGFLQVQNKMILGTQSISRDFAQMGAQLVVSVADAFEKMLAKSLESELRMTLAHQVANQTQVASDSVAAAQTTAITHTTTLQQVSAEAAVVAAKVWGALAGIPIVGPVLGAAAAGAAYTGVMALAAFETGGIIPNTGVAMVHQGEAVLPAPLTNFLMNSATNNNTSNSSASVTQNFNGQARSDGDFRRQLNRNATHVTRAVRRGMRDSGKA